MKFFKKIKEELSKPVNLIMTLVIAVYLLADPFEWLGHEIGRTIGSLLLK